MCMCAVTVALNQEGLVSSLSLPASSLPVLDVNARLLLIVVVVVGCLLPCLLPCFSALFWLLLVVAWNRFAGTHSRRRRLFPSMVFGRW